MTCICVSSHLRWPFNNVCLSGVDQSELRASEKFDDEPNNDSLIPS